MPIPPDRGALIGPGLYNEIKKTIERVGGMPYDATKITRIPTDLSGEMPAVASATAFRIATFTGSWNIGSDKAVTLKSNTASTVMATNLFFPISGSTRSLDIAIARDGEDWYAISVPFSRSTAAFFEGTQTITFVGAGTHASVPAVTNVAASLNTSNCSIGVTQSTQSVMAVAGTQTAAVLSSSAGKFTATYLEIQV